MTRVVCTEPHRVSRQFESMRSMSIALAVRAPNVSDLIK